ncbi:MAG: 4-carboxymuconolactone decarboxylase, partial [Betaproteobacteria bacterium]
MDSELFKKGLGIRKAVVGEEYVNKSLENADEFT